jgi:hypothetical protein
LLSHEARLSNDPDFEPDFSQLVDCRNVTKAKLTRETIQLIAQKNPSSLQAKRATVADRDIIYGLARMYQLLKGDAQIQVFRDMEAARRWLGLA